MPSDLTQQIAKAAYEVRCASIVMEDALDGSLEVFLVAAKDYWLAVDKLRDLKAQREKR